MLPTKGYFQDIECPFYNTNCGRPYCHFRHKKRANDSVDDPIQVPAKNVVPTYKPTPKSELENIHNSRSHIPISYVPDLAFKRDRTVRPVRIQKATYKPTPLSILSSTAKPESSLGDSNLYNPLESDINFEELTNEFDLIDNIIHDTEKESVQEGGKDRVNEDPKFSSDEEKVEVPTLKPPVCTEIPSALIKKSEEIKKEKPDSTTSGLRESSTKYEDSKKIKSNKESDRSSSSSRSKSKSSSRDKDSKTVKSHKSSSRDKHRKEEKKPRQDSKHKHKSASPKEKKRHQNRSSSKSSSGSSSRDSTPSRSSAKKKESRSSSNKHERKRKRSKSPKEKSSKSRSESDSKKRKNSEKNGSKGESKSKDKSEHSRDKDKSRKKEKEHLKKSESKKEEKRKKQISESNTSTSGHDNDQDEVPDTFALDSDLSDVDLNLEDEDETMRECYKIFSEYKPEPIKPQVKPETVPITESMEDSAVYQSKKRTAHAGAENIQTHSKYVPTIVPPKPVVLPGQMLANRYKIAKMAQASQEQDQIMNEVKDITEGPKKPTSLLEAARLHKLKRLQQQKLAQNAKTSGNVVDDILNGLHKPTSSQPKITPKRIAAVPNVALIEKAKERISLVKSRQLQNLKTVAQTQKGGRVAHVPEYSLSDIPDVLQADKSKLPVNVRTRFLTMIADECSKLYALKEDAFNRALNEEFACYEKCKVLATYRNSAMLAVNRLRKEIQERESKGLGPLLNGESATTKTESDFEGKTFYNHVKKWILSAEELDIHGYPKESGTPGKAIIHNRTEINHNLSDDNYRKCSRCGKLHQVDDDGWPLFEEECMYHPLKKRTLRGEQIYLCCKSNDDTGCATSDTHVFDGTESHLLEGFQTTLPPESDSDPRSYQVYALDCEMCYTTRGLELTRVTVIDIDCKTVYESLVKPLNPIIDYNTRFSGITKEQMDRTSTSILQVQANILHLCNSETILVGHSLESDMKALKIVHGNVIDTSVLFPHKMGLPHKRALRALASEYLKKIIQNDVSGHDSAEDAVACMELIKWKLKEDLKVKTK